MTAAESHHAQGVALFDAARFAEALDEFRAALRDSETGELWNDWAAAQFVLGRHEEAHAGFRLALELDPQNKQAEANLQALLSLDPQTNSTSASHLNEAAFAAHVSALVSPDPNEQSYFQTHKTRYCETLNFLPNALPGQRILELGAAFHHLTPALCSLKGYSEVRCNDLWNGGPQLTRTLPAPDGQKPRSVVVDNFDVQSAPWPYPEAHFDAVLFCEMLEHLHTDPLGVLAEINRILRPGGLLLLTTPNISGCHSVEYALRGESPYVYGKFESRGASTDRHNREYTPAETARLARAAGFDTIRLETRFSWWPPDRSTLRLLAGRGESIALRGDNTFLLARKTSSVRERYPDEFYLRLGTQADRRVAQAPSPSLADAAVPSPPRPQNILVIHELVPHFDQSGSDLRLLDVLKELRAQSHRVTLIARDARNSAKYSSTLTDLGIRVFAGDPERLRHLGTDQPSAWSLEKLLREEHFDASILFHWFWSGISIPEHYLSDIRRFSPATRIAVLTDDRHGERERRAARLSGLFSDRERAEDFEFRELAAYRAADLLLYITEADRRHFIRLLPDTPMELLPLVAPHDRKTSLAANPPERAGALFLGNFDNPANRDALDWFIGEIWPIVRKRLPDLQLHVAGNACPPEIADLSNGILVLGKVAGLADVFARALLFVSPIRVGTGVNTKNLQALAHGLPLVTTSVGAEGLRIEDGCHALLADTPLSFTEAIFRLCTQPGLRELLAENGIAYVQAEFSGEHLAACVRKIVSRLAVTHPQNSSLAQLESYRAVESHCPEVLTAQPATYRLVLRTLAGWQLGAGHLSRHRPRAALQQFRHIFTALRGPLPDTLFHRQLLADMARACRGIEDSASALRCESELSRLVPLGHKSGPHKNSSSKRDSSGGAPLLSVIIPTCNRRQTLAICLAALSFQTLSAAQFEVIVVDDGSSDDTADFLARSQYPFSLKVLHQSNLGAGAARNAGVAAASGEYVLLCNDDTIASSTLLAEHLRLQRRHSSDKLAILGQFFPSADCGRRALSFWINLSPFLFPQNTLKPGQICDQSMFVTCNLSIRRKPLLDAGNFDPAFRVAEDTEMGARLALRGYRVRFEPSAASTHEHSRFTSDDLLHRAQIYGAATCSLLQKHPHLLGDGSGPFGLLAESDLARIAGIRAQKSAAAESGLAALRALDDFDLLPLWQKNGQGVRPVDELIQKVASIVPTVYWHHLFGAFLAKTHSIPAPPVPERPSEMALP